MAIRNRDGTLYSGETISEMLAERFAETDFPYVSDILGSDWGRSRDPSPEAYKRDAYRFAVKIYGDPAGHLILD